MRNANGKPHILWQKEREREKQLDALAKRVGFSVVHLEPIITDDAVGSNGAKAKESEGV